jgi:hypothetical protein
MTYAMMNGEDVASDVSHSHNISPDVTESSLTHDTPPSEEPSLCPTYPIELDKWPRVFPITETNMIMVWTSAKIEDNTGDLDRMMGSTKKKE